MNRTVAHLTARSLLGRRRALMLLALPAILLGLCAIVRATAGSDPAINVALLGGFGVGTVVPLLGLIAGTGAIGPEIDDGSVVYLLAKPVGRPVIVRTKVAVAAGVVAAVAAVPTYLAGLVLAGGSGRVALAFAVGALVAGTAYCAVFLLLAVLTPHAVVVGLLYALVWEALVGGFVPGAQVLSIQQWAMSVAEQVLGSGPTTVDAAVSVGSGTALLAIVTVGSIVLAGHRLRSLRPRAGEG